MSNLKEFCKENLFFFLSELQRHSSANQSCLTYKGLFAKSGGQVHGKLINNAQRLFQLAEDKPECVS